MRGSCRSHSRRSAKADQINLRLAADKEKAFETLALRFKDQRDTIRLLEKQATFNEDRIRQNEMDLSGLNQRLTEGMAAVRQEVLATVDAQQAEASLGVASLKRVVGKMATSVAALRKQLADFIVWVE